ncbi:amidase [Paragemmobacter straminiformis]|uniref:Amidase n=1 Tax=Paragemmobacter straminiformis TaxID=2045119 RepID=A0A842I8W6_9RHOB|nr:amidase [Gemmobacter straminiformis]MBC2836492.1 amidase [Gemmobacter straminiformis]
MAETAKALADDLRSGRKDPLDLVAEVYDRIDAHGDAALFIRLTRDRAEAEARAARERLRAGNPASLLDGVPLAWKDLFDLKGTVTTAGSAVLRGAPPAAADAALVRAGMRAGLVTVGAVNMTEFAYSGIGLNPHHGTPRNPRDAKVARSPGGSSSGSGAVVAAGIVPLSIGTDTGGSIRIPAAFNGVVGYKTSTGHHPMGGVFPLSPTLDTLGPLANTVEDCVLVDAALRGLAAPQVRAADVAALDLAVPDAVMFDDLDPAVAEAFDATVARLAAKGARVRRIALPELRETVAAMGRYGPLASAEAMDIHWDRLHGPDEALMDARVVRRIRMGEKMTAVDLIRLHAERARLIATVNDRLGDALLICPTTPSVAMPIGPLEADVEVFFHHNFRTLRHTAIGNFLDWCGLSIPNGADAAGMPTGLMICARHGRDAALLAAGLALETTIRG